MKIERAIELAGNWANGTVNSLAPNELKEYHAAALDALREKKARLDNPPLTDGDLLKMDGLPVWVESKGADFTIPAEFWALVSVDEDSDEITLTNAEGGQSPYEEIFMDIDVYRYKQE